MNFRHTSLILTIFFSISLISQNNIIPNGNLQTCSLIPGSGCNNCPYDGVGASSLNYNVFNWKVAVHSVDNGYYAPKIIDFSNGFCQTLPGLSSCVTFQPDPNATPSAISKKFFRLKADYDRKCKAKKQWHDAVGVTLDNGGVFDEDVTYIIRYKINPIRNTIINPNLINENDVNTCNDGGGNPFYSHIRFFLSEQGPSSWNNGDIQELISVNFNKQIPVVGVTSTDCIWYQAERKFIPNQNNYTTLVIYAENGGAFISDVQVFEECPTDIYIQNKYYDGFIFGPNAILINTNVPPGSNFTERANNNLYAGFNVSPGQNIGSVTASNGSKINYTAANEILLADGFTAEYGSDFAAVILPCPNNYNKSAAYNVNQNPDPTYVQLPPLKNNPEVDQEFEASEIFIESKIFPNPTNNNFIYSAEVIVPGSRFIITNVLNQMVTKKEISETASEVNFEINDLSKGLYFLNHYDAEGKLLSINKIIKE